VNPGTGASRFQGRKTLWMPWRVRSKVATLKLEF